MANPPFNLDISDPTDGALGNAFPANERAFRDNANSYLNTDHDATTGHHKFPLLTTSAKNALTTPPAGMLVFDTTLLQLQTNNGTPSAPIWAAALAGINGRAITSSGSFTILSPNLKVTAIAAGGGGGGGYTGSGPAPGGNGATGGWFICWLAGLTIGDTLTITIGTGGSGGASSATSPTGGANGSSTILASGTQPITTRTAFGGGGGGAGGASTAGIGGMNGGASTGAAGDLLGTGGNGATSQTNLAQNSILHPYGSGGLGVVSGTPTSGSNGLAFFEWVA